eukprot:scaffold7352_cov254-Pinguiococcus_pyrenoidosus.AAC.32
MSTIPDPKLGGAQVDLLRCSHILNYLRDARRTAPVTAKQIHEATGVDPESNAGVRERLRTDSRVQIEADGEGKLSYRFRNSWQLQSKAELLGAVNNSLGLRVDDVVDPPKYAQFLRERERRNVLRQLCAAGGGRCGEPDSRGRRLCHPNAEYHQEQERRRRALPPSDAVFLQSWQRARDAIAAAEQRGPGQLRHPGAGAAGSDFGSRSRRSGRFRVSALRRAQRYGGERANLKHGEEVSRGADGQSEAASERQWRQRLDHKAAGRSAGGRVRGRILEQDDHPRWARRGTSARATVAIRRHERHSRSVEGNRIRGTTSFQSRAEGSKTRTTCSHSRSTAASSGSVSGRGRELSGARAGGAEPESQGGRVHYGALVESTKSCGASASGAEE